MRIDAANLYHVAMQLKAPFETSFGVERERHCVIIQLMAEGLEGWGECVATDKPGYSYETVGTAWHVLRTFFLPATLGKELDSIPALRHCLLPFKGHPMARAGLEMAVWDLMGKVQGVPLAQMLGGRASKVPVGVSVGLQSNPAKLLQVIEAYLQTGYQRIKLKIKPGQDVDYVAATRDAFPDLQLQVDANSAYALDDLATFQAMDPFDLLMIEQPLAEDDLLDHRRLQAAIKTPLCLDESIGALRHARQALEIDACRVINIKAGRVGGLWEAKQIHDYCALSNVPVWCGGMLETNIGRAANLALASLPGFTLPGDISASARYYQQDIADPDFHLNQDSSIDVPDRAGLGITIRSKLLAQYCLRQETIKI